jgi:hypothetical protein
MLLATPEGVGFGRGLFYSVAALFWSAVNSCRNASTASCNRVFDNEPAGDCLDSPRDCPDGEQDRPRWHSAGWDYSLLRDRAPNPAVSDPVVGGVPVVDGEVIPAAAGSPTVADPGDVGAPKVTDPGDVGPGVCRGDVEEPADVPDEEEGDDALPVPAPEAPAPPAPPPPAPPPADWARLGPAATIRTVKANASPGICALWDTILSFLDEFTG